MCFYRYFTIFNLLQLCIVSFAFEDFHELVVVQEFRKLEHCSVVLLQFYFKSFIKMMIHLDYQFFFKFYWLNPQLFYQRFHRSWFIEVIILHVLPVFSADEVTGKHFLQNGQPWFVCFKRECRVKLYYAVLHLYNLELKLSDLFVYFFKLWHK